VFSIEGGKIGGARRNRTADKGFADLCLTTWRPRPFSKELTYKEPNSSHTREAFQPKANDWNNYSINPDADFDANLCIVAEKQIMSSETASEQRAFGVRRAGANGNGEFLESSARSALK
jgi:hypothetical protein